MNTDMKHITCVSRWHVWKQISILPVFIFSIFHKYLLKTSYVQGTVLTSGENTDNKIYYTYPQGVYGVVVNWWKLSLLKAGNTSTL